MEQNPEENKKKRKNRAKGGLDKIVENSQLHLKEEQSKHVIMYARNCLPSLEEEDNLTDYVDRNQNYLKTVDDARAAECDDGSADDNKNGNEKKDKGASTEENAVTYILDEVDRIDDVVELLKLARSGNERAKNRVARKHILLVMHFAHSFNRRYGIDELFAAGSFGLAKAINSYDLESNARFITYASTCIKNAIIDYIRDVKKNESKEEGEEKPKLDAGDYDEPDIEGTDDDALTPNINPQKESEEEDEEAVEEKMRRLLEYFSNLGNDDERFDEEGDNDPHATDDVIDDATLSMLRRHISEAINEVLSKTDRTIIQLKFGLDGMGERKIVEIAQEVGLSPNSTSKHLDGALKKLAKRSILRQYI